MGHLGKLQHQQLAPRLEHAAHLGQRNLLVRHVAQAKGHADEIKMSVRERQLLGVANSSRQDHPSVDQAVAPGAQHGLVDVGMHHLAALAHLFGESQRQIARAAGNIQHALALLQVGDQHRVGLPGAVQAIRHQVVHHVVLGRHGIEHTAHAARLVALVHRLETKMCSAHGGNASCLGDNPVNAWDIRHLSRISL